MVDLVLASSSPRRRQIFERLGLSHRVVWPDVDESVRAGESPEQYVRRAAVDKARHVAQKVEPESQSTHWVVGADTVVVRDGKILGKPKDDNEAQTMLEVLSGGEHHVLTGFCLINGATGAETTHVETTSVWFKKLRRSEIDGYVASGEGLDKAGAYGIQGLGCFLVERIEGNYENVVGLPAAPLVEALQRQGALKAFPQVERGPEL